MKKPPMFEIHRDDKGKLVLSLPRWPRIDAWGTAHPKLADFIAGTVAAIIVSSIFAWIFIF